MKDISNVEKRKSTEVSLVSAIKKLFKNIFKISSLRTKIIFYYAGLIIVIFSVSYFLIYFVMTSAAKEMVSKYTLETIIYSFCEAVFY